MYCRYGPGIIITVTVAPHHAIMIERIYVGDWSWRRLAGEVEPSKILHAARPGPTGIIDLDLTVAYMAHEIASGSPTPNLPMVPSVIVDRPTP